MNYNIYLVRLINKFQLTNEVSMNEMSKEKFRRYITFSVLYQIRISKKKKKEEKKQEEINRGMIIWKKRTQGLYMK